VPWGWAHSLALLFMVDELSLGLALIVVEAIYKAVSAAATSPCPRRRVEASGFSAPWGCGLSRAISNRPNLIKMIDHVRKYYDQDPEREWKRFESGLCEIEYLTTLRLIERHFPERGRICDIGSGPGRYALELAKREYSVTLLDISKRSIEFAQSIFKAQGVEAERFILGNAEDMNCFQDEYFDAALFLGPCYHIVEKNGRHKALSELKRILKPNAVAIVAYLNSWGILRTGVVDFPHRFQNLEYVRSMFSELVFEEPLSGFTVCYWSTPEIAISEVEQVGFKVETYAGVEGFAAGMSPQIETLKETDPEAYSNLVEIAVESSVLPQYRDATDHIHIVVRKG
jgi:S-adenosylmethionine-dependent methyltransferase